MSAQDVYTDEQVAARYDKSKDYVQRKARAGAWPHLRIGRSICFTEAHVAAIDLMHEVKNQQSAAATSWGRKTRRPA